MKKTLIVFLSLVLSQTAWAQPSNKPQAVADLGERASSTEPTQLVGQTQTPCKCTNTSHRDMRRATQEVDESVKAAGSGEVQ